LETQQGLSHLIFCDPLVWYVIWVFVGEVWCGDVLEVWGGLVQLLSEGFTFLFVSCGLEATISSGDRWCRVVADSVRKTPDLRRFGVL